MAELLHRWMRYGYVRPVNVPEDFRAGMPAPFEKHVAGLWGETPEIHGLEGQWLRVKGGALPAGVLVRVDRADDGRFMITGLLVGFRSRQEITWETLRQIKPTTIVEMIFSGFDPHHPAKLVAEAVNDDDEVAPATEFDATAWLAADSSDWPAIDPTDGRALAAFELWIATQDKAGPRAEPVTKPRASVATDLAAFAETYLRHLAQTPRRATTSTAEELHISRATAIRRITECRAAGLLPPKGRRT